jgi:hypothetical protein
MPALVRVALVVLAALAPGRAGAQSLACGPDAEAWAAGCSTDTHAVSLAVCDRGVWVLEARAEATLRVELREVVPGEAAFRSERGLSIRPVLEAADWRAVDPSLRRAFEHVAACVEAIDPPRSAVASDSSRRAHAPDAHGPPIPWLPLAGLALTGASLALDRRRVRAALAGVGGAWLVVALPLATAWVRTVIFDPPAFFHQNGHGPHWIDVALCRTSAYGPGYQETFGWAAWATAPAAERGVFVAHQALSALVPSMVLLLSRLASAPRALALASAALVALDPIATRLSASESYFATTTFFVAAAALAIVAGAPRTSHRPRPRVVAGWAGAALLLAHVVRVHPVAWLPAASCVLLPVALARCPLRARLAHAAALGAIVAAATALVSGEALVAVAGARIVGEYAAGGQHVGEWLPVALVAGVAGAVGASLGRPRARGLVLALVLVGPWAVALRLASWMPWAPPLTEAYLRQLVPFGIVTVAALLARAAPTPRPRRVAWLRGGSLALAALGAWHAIAIAPSALERTTVAEEQRWALAWRDELGPGDTLVYLGRAGRRVLHLPFYGCLEGGPRVVALGLSEGVDLARVARSARRVRWVATSLCSTEEGRARCDEAQRTLGVSPDARLVLPARTLHDEPYEHDRIEVWWGEVP